MPSPVLPALFCLGLLVGSTSAHAYLDPGTGSLLLQGLLAAIASVSYALKLHWQRVKAYLSGQPALEDQDRMEESAE
ncbi:MAG: hypothetical protein OXC05_03845 [Halieaceae bacterium]|nr:hypothetical protein [Halieaceae bacterium]